MKFTKLLPYIFGLALLLTGFGYLIDSDEAYANFWHTVVEFSVITLIVFSVLSLTVLLFMGLRILVRAVCRRKMSGQGSEKCRIIF